jgi:hypothetical protein
MGKKYNIVYRPSIFKNWDIRHFFKTRQNLMIRRIFGSGAIFVVPGVPDVRPLKTASGLARHPV